MDVLLIRHAIAEDRDIFALSGKDDALRPLTPEGRKKMRKAVKGLRTFLPRLDTIASSPLTRAVQTADVLHDAYTRAKRVEIAALAPDEAAVKTAIWLQKQAPNSCIALIGHEPDLGQLATWFMGGDNAEPFVQFKKGAMVLIHFPHKINAGRGMLGWALTPALLRQLSG